MEPLAFLGPIGDDGADSVGDPGPARRARRAGAVVNDERILDAALEELRISGVDALNLSSVAKRAHVTTGAVYGRYENALELTIAVWDERLAARLHAVISSVVDLLGLEAAPADLDERAVALTSPDTATAAALDVVAVARRVPELAEVIVPTFGGWLAEWGATATAPESHRVRVLGTVGGVLGAVLAYRVDEVPRVSWRGQLRAHVGLAHAPVSPGAPPEPRVPPQPTVRSDVPQMARLLASAAEVVAMSGFERATISRVARRAGHTSGLMYRSYASKADLLADAMQAVLLTSYEETAAMTARLGVLMRPGVDRGTIAAAILAGTLSDEWTAARRLRLEVHLAAAHQPTLAATLRHVFERADAVALEEFGWTEPESQRRSLANVHASRAIPLGVQLLHELVGPLDGVDWRPYLVPYLATSRGKRTRSSAR